MRLGKPAVCILFGGILGASGAAFLSRGSTSSSEPEAASRAFHSIEPQIDIDEESDFHRELTALEVCRAELEQREASIRTLEDQLARARSGVLEVLENREMEGSAEYLHGLLAHLLSSSGQSLDHLELINQSADSPDERVQVLSLKYSTAICATEESAIACNRIHLDSALPGLVVETAARFVAENINPAVRSDLELRFYEEPHPRNWGAALALSLSGSPEYLDMWTADLHASRLDAPTLAQCLEGVARHPSGDAVRVALSLIAHEDARVRAALVPILVNSQSPAAAAALDQLADDSHLLVAAALERSRSP